MKPEQTRYFQVEPEGDMPSKFESFSEAKKYARGRKKTSHRNRPVKVYSYIPSLRSDTLNNIRSNEDYRLELAW